MRRRSFLLSGAAGLSAVVAGCSGLAPQTTTAPTGHPFADSTVTVRVDDRSLGYHDVWDITRESLAFWEAHADQYLGFDVDFDLAEEGFDASGDADDTDVDLVVQFDDDSLGCESIPEYSELVLGCAPIIRRGTNPRRPVVAIVVAATRPRGSVLVTTKHEIGHVLGLGHDDDPREIMSNRPEDRIPLYERRIEIWNAVLDGQERTRDGVRVYNHAVSLWDDERYDAASVAFEAAGEDFTLAGVRFDDAREITAEFEDHPRLDTIELETLRTLLDHLSNRIHAAETFTAEMAAASTAMVAGDVDEANARREDGNRAIEEFNAAPAVALQEVAFALGLVRGIDRDETVVDVSDEEL